MGQHSTVYHQSLIDKYQQSSESYYRKGSNSDWNVKRLEINSWKIK